MQGEVLMPLLGGAIIGLSATVMLLFNGRITGISGIYIGLFRKNADTIWKFMFVLGLVVGGFLMGMSQLDVFETITTPVPLVVLAGLLVGFGTRLGSGCTSGHGICGLSRQSPRSLANVMSFMISGIIVVFLLNFF